LGIADRKMVLDVTLIYDDIRIAMWKALALCKKRDVGARHCLISVSSWEGMDLQSMAIEIQI
jgi:hypothetical protein